MVDYLTLIILSISLSFLLKKKKKCVKVIYPILQKKVWKSIKSFEKLVKAFKY